MELREYQKNIIKNIKKATNPLVVLGCGGGKSVILATLAKMTTDKGNRVLFLVHRKELLEQIQETFKVVGVNMSLCEFYMIQTAVKRLDIITTPNLIIVDEAHHATSSSYLKVFEYFPKVYRVGFSATPTRLDGKGLGRVFNEYMIAQIKLFMCLMKSIKRVCPTRRLPRK